MRILTGPHLVIGLTTIIVAYLLAISTVASPDQHAIDHVSSREKLHLLAMGRLFPSNPDDVMVVRNVTKNIITCSLPFSRGGVVSFGARATIVRLTSGALAIFSPVALTASVQKGLEALGNNVKYLIAPDIEHHLYLSDWHAAFPQAHVIGPDGLQEKRAANADITDVPFATIFKAATKAEQKITDEFDADFDYEYVDAHPNRELVFCYRPDKTLIEADMLFNAPMHEQYEKAGGYKPQGLLDRLSRAMLSTDGTAVAQKRNIWYLFSRRDRPGFNQSIRRIDAWDFDRIIPCHGDTIETGGKGIFRKVFEWHLQGKK